jgi:hypothetical protein
MVLKPDHQFSDKRGYVLEHRFVWEEYYNACLLPWTVIHHKNGIRDDNRIENLQALFNGEHSSLTNRSFVRIHKSKHIINMVN